MKKYNVLMILLLLTSLKTLSQNIFYSDNRLKYSPDYRYDVVGMVNNNIIVWKTYLNKHFASEVLIIQPGGAIIKTLLKNWNTKYRYSLKGSVFINNNVLIIPATKGGELRFAKLSLNQSLN